jgi:hypothetical protein
VGHILSNQAGKEKGRALGVLEDKFIELKNAKSAWERWDRQRLYKIRTLAVEHDSPAMATWVYADLRGLDDVSRLILSSITLSFRLDLERAMVRLAQAAQNMTAANAGATALGAATTAAAMANMPRPLPPGGEMG